MRLAADGLRPDQNRKLFLAQASRPRAARRRARRRRLCGTHMCMGTDVGELDDQLQRCVIVEASDLCMDMCMDMCMVMCMDMSTHVCRHVC